MLKLTRERSSHLEVFIEGEVADGVGCRSGSRGPVGGLVLMLLCASHDTGLLVVTNTLLEEVGLAGQRDVLHEVEGVGSIVELLVAESEQQTVSDELDVLAHQGSVHAKESARQGIGQELLLDRDGLGDDVLDSLLARALVEKREQQASEVSVHALVAGDQFVGEGQAGHQTALLQPEDRRERSAEEDTLDSGESDETRSIGRVLIGDPAQSPVSLLLNARN